MKIKGNMIVLDHQEEIQITVPGQEGQTCVYIGQYEGMLHVVGGASIIERITGTGMKDVLQD